MGLALERIRDQLGATDVVLWNAAGQPIGSAGQSRFSLNPERPSAALLRSVREQRAVTRDRGAGRYCRPQRRADGPRESAGAGHQPGAGPVDRTPVFPATLPLPPALVSNAIEVQEANREYQERALARGGLRRMYVGTLTLSLFLAVFGAVLLAVLLGNQLARPLLVLAEGVREVAAGNLSPKAALHGQG